MSRDRGDDAIVTLDQHVAILQKGATQIGGMLGPGGDWSPTIAYTDGHGQALILDAPLLNSHEWRSRYIESTAMYLRSERATVVTVVHSAFRLTDLSESDVRKIIDGETPRAREHPDREEILLMTAIDSSGRVEQWSATITRDENDVPTLGEWGRKPDSVAVTGELVEAFRAAVAGAIPFDEQYDSVVDHIRDIAAVEEEHRE